MTGFEYLLLQAFVTWLWVRFRIDWKAAPIDEMPPDIRRRFEEFRGLQPEPMGANLLGAGDQPPVILLPPPAPAVVNTKATTVTTICIAAQKGGAGKTTLAQCLAVEALRQGMPAAIIDTDPQQSAFKWGERRGEREIEAPTVVQVGAAGSIRSKAAELASWGAQVIIIDTPPHAAATINAALEISTAAVMVTRPNPMDLESLGATWAIVQRMKIPTATIFTQVPPGERARALRLGQGLLDELAIPYCPTPLSYTLSYPYAQAEAMTVQEREPTSKARAEVAEVWSWLRREKIM